GSSNGTVVLWDLTRLPGEVRPPNRLSEKEREELWRDLASADAGIGCRAVLRLSAAPADAIALLRTKLRPLTDSHPEVVRVRRLLEGLDSEKFKVREQAERELGQMGGLARPALERILLQKPSVELRRRVERVLEVLDRPGPDLPLLRR